ncbi:hypothetical protein [Marinobacterium lutimaris]|uniref:Uncharacterized protein n=1 Tax=Marinobacterium lutimaris TaxID=568106 RepID=A0A1H5YPW8_9GAMM|nr:hypothetical protein [Marinobacterium lutimaris]SEG26151.1 hypothetical protein SAMN05444390_1011848 [Marinobacterium lutimaris]
MTGILRAGLLLTLLLHTLLVVAPAQAQPLIEAWLEPAVDLTLPDGSWELIDRERLPEPPLTILQSEGRQLLVNMPGLGLRWVGRSSVQLSEEDALLLECQASVAGRAEDYRNYGLRGVEQGVALHCIDRVDEDR